MDTDDLTEMAWNVIVRAARVSDTLKAELGAMACRCRFQSEDKWLQGVRAHLKELAAAPDDYVDSWDLENEESVTAGQMKKCAMELCDRVDQILATPIHKRG